LLNFNFPIIKEKFKQHTILREKILKAINNQEVDSLNEIDNYYTDKISRLDWNQAKNANRPWVQLFINDFINHLNKEMLKLSLTKPKLSEIWFQQYFNNDTHGWHTHGNNFTGVYYLELNDCSPRTQLVEPVSLNLVEVDAEEGDIVIFPSIYIHRAPRIKTEKRKTIISFNFDCNVIYQDTLDRLKNLYGI